MFKAKYIVVDYDMPYIFPEMISHDRFAYQMNAADRVTSAGFVYVNAEGSYSCYGESISLRVKSNPTADNYGVEKEAPVFDDSEEVYVFRKVNGFMVAVTYHNDKLIVSTTGSLDSEFVGIAMKHIEKSMNFIQDLKYMPEYTAMFECCDPSDPHIVDEAPGLYYIGLRNKISGVLHLGTVKTVNKETGLCLNHWNIVPVEQFVCTVGELKEKAKTVKHEGFVFYNEKGIGAKIKSPYYLTKKALMRKNIDKLMAMDAKEFLDEEFYPLIDWIREVDRENFAVLDEIARREYIENWFKK